MRSAYARSPKGQAAYASEPYRPEGKVKLLACMSLEGVLAPWLVEGGTVNTNVFSHYLEHILCPQLKPGQILVLDNYPVHKASIVRDLLNQRDCKLLLLPTYSPDLNPIEMLFGKLKQILKRVSASTPESLSLAIHNALKQVTLQDLIAWFRHAGYTIY